MVGKSEMCPLLVEACPSFKPQWTEFVREWKDDLDPPLYLALGEFAHHLIDRLAVNDTGDFPNVFAVVERLHVEGDTYVKEAVTVGLLEAIQNVCSHRKIPPASSDFEPYLGPESRRWWNKLFEFWDKGKLLTDD